jgi:hypothetical protein
MDLGGRAKQEARAEDAYMDVGGRTALGASSRAIAEEARAEDAYMDVGVRTAPGASSRAIAEETRAE